jgi:hypothetical protein
MSSDAGMLSAAVGAAGAAHCFQQPSSTPRYYQCVSQGLKTTCAKITDSTSFRYNMPHAIIEVPAAFPAALDKTYVAWRIRSLTTVCFTVD